MWMWREVGFLDGRLNVRHGMKKKGLVHLRWVKYCYETSQTS